MATSDEIKSVYRRLSKEYHPDINQHRLAEAEEKMMAFTSAYQVISHPEKRRDYDTQPMFRPRVPRGFSSNAVSSKLLTRKDEAEKKPTWFDKVKSYFIVDNRVKRDPTKAMTYFAMGMTMTEKVDFFPDAKIEFSKSFKADPLFFEAAFNLGLMCYKLGEFDQARKCFEAAAKLDAKDSIVPRFLDLLRPE